MSIFCSWEVPDEDDHVEGCALYVETEPGCFDFSGAPCDCGQPYAPLVYQGSNVLPSNDDPRGGTVDIASIPSHITREGRDDQPEDGTPYPWLRFGVNEGTVILTPSQVEQIRDALSEWLEAVAIEAK